MSKRLQMEQALLRMARVIQYLLPIERKNYQQTLSATLNVQNKAAHSRVNASSEVSIFFIIVFLLNV